MEISGIADEEENERKLLADTSDEESEEAEKIDDEVLASDSEDHEVKAEDKDMSDDDSEDNSDDEDDEADEAEVRIIEAKLANDPYDYDAHKKLIEKLQSMGELLRLRAARESMSRQYPLTTEIWLSWLRDEMKLADTPEQKNAVMELCERAVNDYLCKYKNMKNCGFIN